MNTCLARHPKWPAGDIVSESAYGKYTVYEIKDSKGNLHYCCGHLVQPCVDSLHGLIDHMEEHLQYFAAQNKARQLQQA